VLAACLTAGTTEIKDVDGGPLGVLAAGPTATNTKVEDVDGAPLGGDGAKDPGAQHLWSPPLS
jgi:hypothetical protein